MFFQKVHVENFFRKNRQKNRCQFFLLSRFRVFLSDVSSNTLQKTFCVKYRVEKCLLKIDKRIQNRIFPNCFNQVFGRFSARGVKKHDKNLKTNLTNPGTFLASEELVNHVKARRFFFLRAPWAKNMGQGPPRKKRKQRPKSKTTQAKNNRPTSLSFPPPFFFAGVKRYARRLWTSCPPTSYHRMWWPAAGSGVFLYELVPSDDPFIWYLCETQKKWLLLLFFSNRHFFFPSEK
jgi:hypothetical protein